MHQDLEDWVSDLNGFFCLIVLDVQWFIIIHRERIGFSHHSCQLQMKIQNSMNFFYVF